MCATHSLATAMASDALTFEELRDLFVARGYHKTPLSLDGLPDKSRAVLLDVLRALVREHDEEAAVQAQLLARNRELEHSVQRTQRHTRQASEQTHSTEARLHAAETQLESAQRTLRAEQAAHRTTREQLARTRREMQHVKAGAAQHRTVTERGAERLRDRMASATLSNLKALVPDIRIASPAFVAKAGVAEAGAEQQLAAAEQRSAALMEGTHALKQLAVDALDALHQADVRLQKILDVEAPREARPRVRADAPDVAHIFPPLRPLVTDDTEETHPARRRLWTLSRALQEHVAQLSQWAAARHVRRDAQSELAAVEAELGEVEAQLGGGGVRDEGGGVGADVFDESETKRRRVSD